MTTQLPRTGPAALPITWGDSRLQKKADIYLFGGALLCGTLVFGLLGLPLLVYGLVLWRRARDSGEVMRPFMITLIGVFIAIDGGANYAAWGTDLFPMHDTEWGLTFWSGFGRLVDGGYYLYYNSTPLGGTSFVGEKSIQFGCVLMLFPMRIAAVWAFLRMKRWGHQMLVITGWMYLLAYIVWITEYLLQFDVRAGASLYGVVIYWCVNFFAFFGAFITMPYLYTLDSRSWR